MLQPDPDVCSRLGIKLEDPLHGARGTWYGRREREKREARTASYQPEKTSAADPQWPEGALVTSRTFPLVQGYAPSCLTIRDALVYTRALAKIF